MESNSAMKNLQRVLYASGAFDIFGGIYFILLVGEGKSIKEPLTHPIYSMIIASFLICLGLLQYLTASNIKRYVINIGIVMLSRVLYGALFFSYLIVAKDFPTTFLPTAISDLIWVIVYILLVAFSKEIQLKDLYIPSKIGV